MRRHTPHDARRLAAPAIETSTIAGHSDGDIADYSRVVSQCQRAAARAPVDRLDRAIDAVAEVGGKAPGRRGGVRYMSKAARASR